MLAAEGKWQKKFKLSVKFSQDMNTNSHWNVWVAKGHCTVCGKLWERGPCPRMFPRLVQFGLVPFVYSLAMAMSLLLFDSVDIRINVRLSFVRRQSWVLEMQRQLAMHLNAKLGGHSLPDKGERGDSWNKNEAKKSN